MPVRPRSPFLAAATLLALAPRLALAQAAPDAAPGAAPAPAATPSPATPTPAAPSTPAPAASPSTPTPSTPRHHVTHHARHHHDHGRVPHAVAATASPVLLTQQPGTALDAAARRLASEDLSDAARRRETPIVLIGSAPLSTAHTDPALFVQLQSASLCGSAGCSTSVYLERDGAWTKVLDSVSGPIKMLPTAHGGMHDLMVGDRDRWIWGGGTYHDTLPAAPIGNLRSSVERHRALTGQKGG